MVASIVAMRPALLRAVPHMAKTSCYASRMSVRPAATAVRNEYVAKTKVRMGGGG